VALTDPNILMFGGTEGVLYPTVSWIIGGIASIVVILAVLASRRNKQHHGFIVKPVWAEVTLIGMIVAIIMGFVAVLNSQPHSRR
jgi:D-xylose transport system permease protein